ncbi:MAG: amphi-Trp domain-containing protein [Desulfonatronovibrionaceae bacterium]
MSKENKFSHESIQDSQSIKQFLEALEEGLEKGTMHLSNQTESIDLFPQGLLKFSIKAKRKDETNKISLKIEWKDSRTSELISTAPVNITATE